MSSSPLSRSDEMRDIGSILNNHKTVVLVVVGLVLSEPYLVDSYLLGML